MLKHANNDDHLQFNAVVLAGHQAMVMLVYTPARGHVVVPKFILMNHSNVQGFVLYFAAACR